MNMRIPRMFSRIHACARCLENQLPYDSSERLKRHTLDYLVKPGSCNDPKLFQLRRQSRVGRLGFTPHIFLIEEEITMPGSTQRYYRVGVACGVDGCGVHLRVQPHGDRAISVDYRIAYFSEDELVSLYYYKDVSYMLDHKEDQHRYCPELYGPLSPN